MSAPISLFARNTWRSRTFALQIRALSLASSLSRPSRLLTSPPVSTLGGAPRQSIPCHDVTSVQTPEQSDAYLPHEVSRLLYGQRNRPLYDVTPSLISSQYQDLDQGLSKKRLSGIDNVNTSTSATMQEQVRAVRLMQSKDASEMAEAKTTVDAVGEANICEKDSNRIVKPEDSSNTSEAVVKGAKNSSVLAASPVVTEVSEDVAAAQQAAATPTGKDVADVAEAVCNVSPVAKSVSAPTPTAEAVAAPAALAEAVPAASTSDAEKAAAFADTTPPKTRRRRINHFVSPENPHGFRPHVFARLEAMSPEERQKEEKKLLKLRETTARSRKGASNAGDDANM